MEVAAGAGPQKWSVRAFFAFSLLGIGWVGCSARFRVSVTIS